MKIRKVRSKHMHRGMIIRFLGRVFLFLVAAIPFAIVIGGAQAAVGIFLAPGELIVVNGVQCGQVNGGWIPGSILRSGAFYPLTDKVKALKKVLKKKNLSEEKRQRTQAKIKLLKKRLKSQVALCANVPNILSPTPIPTSIATPHPDATTIAWQADVQDQALNVGAELLFFCPSNVVGSLDSIYGTSYYTTDSAVCVAGLHMGLVSRIGGGNVKVRIKGVQPLYIGSVRNGVESSFYGSYPSSYVFIDIVTGAEIVTTDVPEIKWSTSAAALYQYNLAQFTFFCPKGGSAGSVWGTDIYTYDSSVCTAAVHVGLISFAQGGVVTVVLMPGQASYAGSTRNGVTSRSYGPWSGSFVFSQ